MIEGAGEREKAPASPSVRTKARGLYLQQPENPNPPNPISETLTILIDRFEILLIFEKFCAHQSRTTRRCRRRRRRRRPGES